MRRIYLFVASYLCLMINVTAQVEGSFTDPRDGETYKTVTFNNDLGMGVFKSQTWMAENLRYMMGEETPWYENDSLKHKKYGRYYTWELAKRACPLGWHLPSDVEWQILVHQLFKGGGVSSNSEELYKQLLEGGESNFAALLGGTRDGFGEFVSLSKNGLYWSASEKGADNAWFYDFSSFTSGVNRGGYDKSWAFSCRCLQN